jgi:hypothetical protein
VTFATRTGLFDILTGTSYTSTDPLVTAIDLGDAYLTEIDIRIPPGHCGTTGIQVMFNGALVVPWADDSSWLIADDERLNFPVNTEVDTQLTVNTYNTDLWDHTFYCRFVYTPMTLITASAPSTVAVVPIVAS